MEPIQWYKSKVVQYSVVEGALHREIFLKDYTYDKYHLRPLNIFSKNGMEYAVQRFQFHKRNYHFYASVATLDNNKLPHTPPDLSELDEARKAYNEAFESAVIGYDYVVDIDNDLVKWKGKEWQRNDLVIEFRERYNITHKEAKAELARTIKEGEATELPEKSIEASRQQALKINSKFTNENLPFYQTFSGSKGFHFRIDWGYISQVAKISPLKFVDVSKRITGKLITRLGLKNIDLRVYDARRVLRVPYTLHPKTFLVCLPLSDEQLENFSTAEMTPDYVMNKAKQRLYTPQGNRGYLKRKFEKDALKSFLDRFGDI